MQVGDHVSIGGGYEGSDALDWLIPPSVDCERHRGLHVEQGFFHRNSWGEAIDRVTACG